MTVARSARAHGLLQILSTATTSLIEKMSEAAGNIEQLARHADAGG
jgi:hypothetical protein